MSTPTYIWHLSGQGRPWEVERDLGDAWAVREGGRHYIVPKSEYVEYVPAVTYGQS